MVMLLTRVHLLPVCPQTTLLLYSTDGHVHVLFGEHHVGVNCITSLLALKQEIKDIQFFLDFTPRTKCSF